MKASRGSESESPKAETMPLFNPEDIATNRDYSKLRKAAASQSLSKLKDAISLGSWAAKDIDDNDAYNHTKGKQKQRQHASKSALHMAAWKGCLDNAKYLIETVGCDIDAYSKQEFSYGKTAIFFALTQSRPEITEYLLEKGAKVTIVNNKGQSVLSMAATHFEDAPDGSENRIVQTIREMEAAQGDWWNFRATHSDGFEYGDMDPRFFNDRPLRDTDVVTPLAINPTNKQTRKGGFLKRNPEAVECKNACARGVEAPFKQSKKRNRKKALPPALSTQEQCELNRAWGSLLATPPSSSSEAFDSVPLLEILRLSDKQRSSWIPQAVIRLTERFGEECSIRGIEKAINQTDRSTPRRLQLLEKILGRLQADDQQQQQENDDSVLHKAIPECDSRSDNRFDCSELWLAARQDFADLRISCLEEADSPILTLSAPPIFVDTPDALRNLLSEILKSRLVALDSEWYTPSENNNIGDVAKPKAALSTLQLSVWRHEDRPLVAYVIDLMHEKCAESNHEYQRLAQSLIQNLLEACGDAPNPELPLILGFAIHHDLPMLEGFLASVSFDEIGDGDSGGIISVSVGRRNRSCYPRVLDLQSVFADDDLKTKLEQQQQRSKAYRSTTSNLPGLKACVSKYTSVPLSKDCQCSDWGRRPLSKAQLEYAGLDAAILLVLLAERSREATR